MSYHLLDAFRETFQGKRYIHRDSSLGDFVAMQLYEDLFAVGKSRRLARRIEAQERVLNVQNKRRGIKARRGDGTFGELIPGVTPIQDPGFKVARGPVATVEIGTEVKILAKAMIKQIDRVIGNLKDQVDQFQKGGGAAKPICIGVVGVNHSDYTVGYEGDRSFRTDGSKHKHPIHEAAEATRRLLDEARPRYDEFLILPYKARNEEPYRFSWLDLDATTLDYGAILTRISREYDRRFRNGDVGASD